MQYGRCGSTVALKHLKCLLLGSVVSRAAPKIGLMIRSILKTVHIFARDPIFRGLLLAAVFALIVGTIFYHLLEGWSLIDAFYFSTITLATVGYGDFVPSTDVARLFTIVYVMFGAGIFATFVTAVALVRLQQVEATRPIAQSRATSLEGELKGAGIDPRLSTTSASRQEKQPSTTPRTPSKPRYRRRRDRSGSRSAAP
jgi:hypothetical protein